MFSNFGLVIYVETFQMYISIKSHTISRMSVFAFQLSSYQCVIVNVSYNSLFRYICLFMLNLKYIYEKQSCTINKAITSKEDNLKMLEKKKRLIKELIRHCFSSLFCPYRTDSGLRQDMAFTYI